MRCCREFADLNLAAFLRVMAEGHRVNIGTLDAALKQGAS